MEVWSIVVPTLVAVLVGAILPLVFQAWLTVRSARKVLERADRVIERADRITERLDGQRLDEMVAAVDGVTRAARQIGDGVKMASTIGATLGPAAAAAIHAWQASRPRGAAKPPPRPRNGPDTARQQAPSAPRDEVSNPVRQEKEERS